MRCRFALAVALIVASAAFAAIPDAAGAQIGGSGAIQGTVLDSSGATLPGATVTATNAATGVSTVRQTTAAGVFTLSPLAR